MESPLFEKLKLLGVTLGVPANSDKFVGLEQYPMEKEIPGEVISTPEGETFITQNNYPDTYSHGNIELRVVKDIKIIFEWAGITPEDNINIEKILFLDTETSGLVGGTGTLVFMVGMGFFTKDGFCVQQLCLRDPGEEAAMLVALAKIIDPFEVLVTFNGKSFDVPMLTTRHILNGFTSPLNDILHVDLLHLARRLWRNRLPSRALGELEREILGVIRAEEEVPGWLVPQIYFEYLRTGDARPLRGIFYHNVVDILSLAALFIQVANLLRDPLSYPNMDSLDLAAIGKLYEDLGKVDEALPIYERSINQGLPEQQFIRTVMQNASLYRKKGDWERAVQLWINASKKGGIDACIELAKYYEHQTRDYSQAIFWCEEERIKLNKFIPNPYFKKKYLEELELRVSRLKRKIFA